LLTEGFDLDVVYGQKWEEAGLPESQTRKREETPRQLKQKKTLRKKKWLLEFKRLKASSGPQDIRKPSTAVQKKRVSPVSKAEVWFWKQGESTGKPRTRRGKKRKKTR